MSKHFKSVKQEMVEFIEEAYENQPLLNDENYGVFKCEALKLLTQAFELTKRSPLTHEEGCLYLRLMAGIVIL